MEEFKSFYKTVASGEDEPIAYKYWKQYVNPNPYDCCNLRM